VPALATHADLVAVFDIQDKEAALVTDLTAARRAAPYGHRVVFIDLADPIARVRRAFERATTQY
jgi:hypothetical protein